MDETRIAEHGKHLSMTEPHDPHGSPQGPRNTLPMMAGEGPFGAIEMSGMFTVVKLRDDLPRGGYRDPGWYQKPEGTVAYKS